jgi:paraquat-inducible protein A
MHQSLLACPQCDLLVRSAPLARNCIARCSRCYAMLYRPHDDDLDRPLAYTLAAAILFIVANVFPIVGLELQGQTSTATLFGMAQTLWQENMKPLAALVFFTTILVPALELCAMVYLLVPLRLGTVPSRLPTALRMLQAVRPWGMTEVFILGLLVAVAKLAGMASVQPGIALWSFGGLLMMIAAAVASFDARVIWSKQALAG